MATTVPSNQGPNLNIKTISPGVGISMLKIRRSWDHLIFNMGILILVRWRLNIEMVPWFFLLPHYHGFSELFSIKTIRGQFSILCCQKTILRIELFSDSTKFENYPQMVLIEKSSVGSPSEPVFCFLLGASSDSARPITGQACDWLSIVWAYSKQETEKSSGLETWPKLHRNVI